MNERLAELVRQRALLQEHLAWLDREIAVTVQKDLPPSTEVSAAAPLPAMPANSSTPAPALSSPLSKIAPLPAEITKPGPEAAPLPAADEILEKYRPAPAAVNADVRKGCFLYFAAAFVLLGLVVTILYYTISSR